MLKIVLGTLMLLILGCSSSSVNENGREVVKLGVITDIHHSDKDDSPTDPGEGRFYSAAIPKTRDFIDTMNKEKVDFVIQLGDLTDMPKDNSQPMEVKNKLTLDFAKDMKKEFSRFKGNSYHVFGNHDTDYSTKQEYVEAIGNTMVDVDEDRFYFSFDKNGIRFIVIDASYHEDGRHLNGYEGYRWTDTYVPEKQLIWLENKLSDGIPTVVFSHQLVDLGDDSVDPSHMIINNKEVKKILEKNNNVLAMIQGHWHKGDYKISNGIHYITMKGNVDFGTDVEKYNQYGLVEIIETSSNSYEIVVEGNGEQDSYRLKRNL